MIGIGILINNTSINKNEMKYPSQTINLVAGVQYDLTTTIASTREIYNVLADYGGTDAEVDISWATSGGYWHVYLTSTGSISGVKVKILYA